jgi:NitT/TauT family transport system substrate-binding protein
VFFDLEGKWRRAAHRYKALRERNIEAITVAEPFISLAEKDGMRVLCEARYQGVENFLPDIDQEALKRATLAVDEASRLIQADKKKYLHFVTAIIPPELGQLTPEEFHNPRIDYFPIAPFTQKDFETVQRLIVKWGLLGEEASFDRLVQKGGS